MNGNKGIIKERKKKTCLSISQKIEIIKQLNNGAKQEHLAVAYHVTRPTISFILKCKDRIIEHDRVLKNDHGSSAKKKRFSNIENSSLEKIVFSWFLQKRELGLPISGTNIQEVAKIVNQRLGGSSDFKASNGWLQKFKERHGIRQLSIQGDQLSADTGACDLFCDWISNFITSEGYSPDCVYNADEAGLQWKCLPDKTLAYQEETRAYGRKMARERITIMVCANATGTHKIPLTCIGKFKRPHCFHNVDVLPVNYLTQENAWMNKKLFIEWYKNIFLPALRSRQTEEKCLLLLDNAHSHPQEEELNMIDPICQVKYLPPNVTRLIQPMDQGVIITLKRLYKRSFLREYLITGFEQNGKAEAFLKSWNLVKCFDKLSVAWEQVTRQLIYGCWNKVFWKNGVEEHLENVTPDINILANRICSITPDEVNEWLDSDKLDCGWPVRTVDELIDSVANPSEIHSLSNEENNDQEEEDNNVPSMKEAEIPVSPEEALAGINVFQKWYMSRWDGDPKLLINLGLAKEFAAKITSESGKYDRLACVSGTDT